LERPPSCDWLDDQYSALQFGAEVIKMDDLAGSLANSYHDLKSELGKLCFDQPTPAPPSRESKVNDSFDSDKVGSNFIEYEPNGLIPATHHLATTIVRTPALYQRHVSCLSTVDGTPTVVWNTTEARKWLDRSKAFLSKLAALIHLTYGSTARGKEFCLLRIINDASNKRNIFFRSGKVVILTGYHKSRILQGRNKVHPIPSMAQSDKLTLQIIARYLPDHISQLFLSYLIIARPLELIFLRAVFGQAAEAVAANFLFHKSGVRWESADLSASIRAHFLTYLRVDDITVASYRHIQVAISRLHRTDQALFEDGDEVEDLQAGHSTGIARAHYAQLGSVSKIEAVDMIAYLKASQRWWEAVGVVYEPVKGRQPDRRVADILRVEPDRLLALTKSRNDLQYAMTALQRSRNDLQVENTALQRRVADLEARLRSRPSGSSASSRSTDTPRLPKRKAGPDPSGRPSKSRRSVVRAPRRAPSPSATPSDLSEFASTCPTHPNQH
jgi:hypothetical protein